MDDDSTQFRLTAERLYPEMIVNSLCTVEHIIAGYESRTGKRVTTFLDYLTATRRTSAPNGIDTESQTWFNMWWDVRQEMERGTHGS